MIAFSFVCLCRDICGCAITSLRCVVQGLKLSPVFVINLTFVELSLSSLLFLARPVPQTRKMTLSFSHPKPALNQVHFLLFICSPLSKIASLDSSRRHNSLYTQLIIFVDIYTINFTGTAEIVLLAAPPACGKSTLARRFEQG